MATKVESVTAVRPQVREMLSPGSDEEFEKSLPDSTLGGEPSPDGALNPPRRKRRTKEEMAAARAAEGKAPASAPALDPLMSDPRYARIMAKMSGMGGEKIISLGFQAAGSPLKTEEKTDVDDCFYVISKRAGFNPGESWFALIIYMLAVILQLVIARTDLAAKITELLKPMEQPKKAVEKVEGKTEATQEDRFGGNWQNP